MKSSAAASVNKAASDSNNQILTLGSYDILCGRCKTAFNNVGNRRFRVTISMNLQAYLNAKSKIERSTLISSIVSYLTEEVGARFLKPKKGGGYATLSTKQAREKVGHALRDSAVAKEQSTMSELADKQRQKECGLEGSKPAAKPFDEDANNALEKCMESLFDDIAKKRKSSETSSDEDVEPLPLSYRKSY